MKTEKNILIAFILNLGFSIFELLGGLFTGSISILSDSLHDLGDAMSIGISFFLEKKSKKKPDSKYTYGYVRYSVMGSIITTVILIIGSMIVIYEAKERIKNPVAVDYNGMIVLAILGVIINLIATYFTSKGDSLNQKSVNLHMLEDVLGWVVVLIGAICMKFTNIIYIDAILSICVAIFILINAMKNLKSVMDIFLEKTPKDVNLDEIKKCLLEINGVEGVHHIHVRSMDGYNNYATLHVIVNKYSHEIKEEIKHELKHKNICHSTIELELKNEECDEENCEVESHVSEGHEHHHHHH